MFGGGGNDPNGVSRYQMQQLKWSIENQEIIEFSRKSVDLSGTSMTSSRMCMHVSVKLPFQNKVTVSISTTAIHSTILIKTTQIELKIANMKQQKNREMPVHQKKNKYLAKAFNANNFCLTDTNFTKDMKTHLNLNEQ